MSGPGRLAHNTWPVGGVGWRAQSNPVRPTLAPSVACIPDRSIVKHIQADELAIVYGPAVEFNVDGRGEFREAVEDVSAAGGEVGSSNFSSNKKSS